MRFFWEFLFSMVIMGLLGMAFGFVYVKMFHRTLMGGVRAGMTIGTLGCILGGFMFNVIFDIPLFKWLNTVPYLKILLVNKFDTNFIAAFLGTWLFLHVYKQISSQNY